MTGDVLHSSKPTRPRAEIMAFSTSMEDYIESSNTIKETNNIIVVMFDEMNYHYFDFY